MFYSFEDASVRTTGRWGSYEGNEWVFPNTICTTAPGAKCEIAFCGAECILHFDMNFSMQPVPHLWMWLDDGAATEVPLDWFLRVRCENGTHTLTFVLKSEVEQFNRWAYPLINKVAFRGYEADAAGVLPANDRPLVELIGDSITEGVLVDAGYQVTKDDDQYNRPYQDDSMATYAYLSAQAMGWEPLTCAYGAVGVSRHGCGGVPSAPDMYPYCFADVPMRYDRHPDYVMINHGTNDHWNSSEAFVKGYIRLLDAVYAAHPDTQVIAIIPFVGWQSEELRQLIPAYAAEHGKDILLVDTEGWLPPEPIHPLRDGHKIAAERLTAVLKEKFG